MSDRDLLRLISTERDAFGKRECELMAERDAYREALEFYSAPAKYHTHHSEGYGLQKSDDKLSQMDMDSGQVARDVLDKFKKEEK